MTVGKGRKRERWRWEADGVTPKVFTTVGLTQLAVGLLPDLRDTDAHNRAAVLLLELSGLATCYYNSRQVNAGAYSSTRNGIRLTCGSGFDVSAPGAATVCFKRADVRDDFVQRLRAQRAVEMLTPPPAGSVTLNGPIRGQAIDFICIDDVLP